MRQKGQAIWKFIKVFIIPPSLIQGNSEGVWATKMRTVYKLFTGNTPTICADSEQVCTTIRTTIYELFTCVLSNELFAQWAVHYIFFCFIPTYPKEFLRVAMRVLAKILTHEPIGFFEVNKSYRLYPIARSPQLTGSLEKYIIRSGKLIAHSQKIFSLYLPFCKGIFANKNSTPNTLQGTSQG